MVLGFFASKAKLICVLNCRWDIRYERIKWKRNIPKSRINSFMILGAFAGISTYGLWKVITGNATEA